MPQKRIERGPIDPAKVLQGGARNRRRHGDGTDDDTPPGCRKLDVLLSRSHAAMLAENGPPCKAGLGDYASDKHNGTFVPQIPPMHTHLLVFSSDNPHHLLIIFR